MTDSYHQPIIRVACRHGLRRSQIALQVIIAFWHLLYSVIIQTATFTHRLWVIVPGYRTFIVAKFISAITASAFVPLSVTIPSSGPLLGKGYSQLLAARLSRFGIGLISL